jgi:hypothetical protein
MADGRHYRRCLNCGALERLSACVLLRSVLPYRMYTVHVYRSAREFFRACASLLVCMFVLLAACLVRDSIRARARAPWLRGCNSAWAYLV